MSYFHHIKKGDSMKKFIITSLVTGTIIASSALAYNNQGCNFNKDKMQMKQKGAKSHQMQKMRKAHKPMPMMQLFSQLNLTPKQQNDVQKIMQENRMNRKGMFSAFGKDSFDKEKFIKHATQKRENMIKLRADTLEKAYNVLTQKQKQQLRVLMDLKEEKGSRFDKYSNGRG